MMESSYHGLNVLPEPKTTPIVLIFLRQFQSFLTVLLLLAAAISFLARDFLDGGMIFGILLLNGLIGFFQEYKAKKDVAALKKMVVSVTRVIRNGVESQIESKFLVPGDVVLLESGDRVPADGELLAAVSLTVDEASLTGESVPVVKERNEPIYMGTVVLSGRAKFKVTTIGVNTRFGQIAKDLEAIAEEKTPLEIRMADLGKKIGIFVICLMGLMGLMGFMQGRDMLEMFFSGVALAVAAVPEGLPAVLTIALAVGVRRLSKRGAIVKRLAATEALGSVDVILTDKTGTLTKNEMTVKKVVTASGEDDLMPHLLKTMVICNSSSLAFDRVLGDTTEGALLLFARDKGVDYEKMRRDNPIDFEIPFNAETRIMTVKVGGNVYSKGAPEKIIKEEKFLLEAKRMASLGLRVLAFSKNDQFLGLVGIYDAPRPEVKNSIAICKGAGIHVVMATGDYPETAKAIASEIGLLQSGEEVVTGWQLAEYSDEVLRQNLLNIRVFARVTPADKLRIVEAYQALGRVVAVTGDGVNDAPALKRAQVGVAMGITGTDVAKEAADLIITDDNFATIVVAIEEGRVIFVNLVKSIKFLLASNFGEVLTVVGAMLLGLPIPLSPLALLWINVVSDGLPALALAVDTKDGEILRRSAHEIRRGRAIFDQRDLGFLGGAGFVLAFLTVSLFWLSLPRGEEFAKMAAFSVLVALEMVLVFVVRGRKQILFSNKFLVASVLVILAVQMLIFFVPQIREVFI